MTVAYTTNLALAQPVTGTESGTWGDDVNNGVTAYLDIAIAGGLAVTVTVADVTLTNTQGTSSGTNIGSTTAQYAILNVSGAMTAARNLIVPSTSKSYIINNATTGGFTLTVKGSATTGVGLINGERAIVAWNGSDYVKIATNTITALTGTLTVPSGGTGATTLTGVVIGNGTSAFTTVTAPTGAIVGTTDTQTLTNKTLTNPTVTNYVESIVAIGTVTTSNTLSLTNGTVQTATLTASTACTFTMPTATAGKSFILLLKQAATTGAGTATFTGVKWSVLGAPTITSTAGKMDILTFVADGTNWYGSYVQGYTP